MRTLFTNEHASPPWILAAICGVLLLAVATPSQAIEPGQKAPNFKLKRLDGKGNLGLSDYKGKVIYLDFWASWCAPCLEAVPAIEKLRGEFPESKFQVLAVNVDKKTKKALKFLEKQNVDYPSVSNPKGDLPSKFALETMPTSYLIDQKGVVRYVHEGFRDGDLTEIREQVRKLVK